MNTHPHFDLAVFDLAGTTVVDTNTVGASLQYALQEAGVNISQEEATALMGIPKPIAIAQLLQDHEAEGDVSKIYKTFHQHMLEVYRTSPEIKEIEGTSTVFAALQQMGIRVAVDTGFDRTITDQVLQRMAWGSLLSDSIASDEVARGRPFPDMILELCRRNQTVPNRTIKIGDTPADLQEGHAAQVKLNVGVTYGTHSAEQLQPHKPDVLINSISKLLAQLNHG
jgi:phosphonatase-like hydrolase